MRWCVSIGVVLVAGAMAGGDVAGIAAPSTRNQLTDPLGPRPGLELAAPKDASVKVLAWRHLGVGTGDSNSIYSSKRVSEKDAGSQFIIFLPCAPVTPGVGRWG